MTENKNITIQKLNENHTINFNIKSFAKSLRDKLIENQFISEDNNAEKWRFIIPNTNNVPLQFEVEGAMPIELLLTGTDKLKLINTVEEKKILVGTETGWFTDRDLECKITLNPDFTQERFQPIMLEHVVSTGENAYDYDNVVLCQKDTAIEFGIKVKGHNGFGLSIKPDKGDYVCDNLYGLSTDVREKDIFRSLSRYQREKKNIVIDSADTLNIPGKEAMKYQRVTVKVWKVNSFEEDSITYYDEYENGEYGSSMALQAYDAFDASSVDPLIDPNRLIHMPTSSIGPAVLTPRGESRQEFGSCSLSEDSSHLLGQVFIHFFIFKTDEDAREIFSTRKLPKFE